MNIGRLKIILIVSIIVLNLYIGYSLISFSTSLPEQYAKIDKPKNFSVNIIKNPFLDLMSDYYLDINQINDLSLVLSSVWIRNRIPNSTGSISFFEIALQGFPFKMTLNNLKNIDDKNVMEEVKGPFLRENNVNMYEIHFKNIESTFNTDIRLQMDYQLSVPIRQYMFGSIDSQFISSYPFDGYTVWVPIFYKPALNMGGQDFSPYNTLDAKIKLQDGFILDKENSGLYVIEAGVTDYHEERDKNGYVISSSWRERLYEYPIDNGIYHDDSNTLTVHGSDLSNLPFPRLKFTLERPIISKILFILTLIFSIYVCFQFIKNGVQVQNLNFESGKKELIWLPLLWIPSILAFYGLHRPSTLTILDIISIEPILVLILLSLVSEIRKLTKRIYRSDS